MAEYGASVESTASPDRVWKVWSDTSTWGEWNPNVTTMDMEGPFQSGTRAVMNTPSNQHHKMTLLDVQPGKGFALETSVIPGTTFRFNCRIEPNGSGSRVGQWVEVKGPLGFLGFMFGPNVSKEFPTLLRNLAKKAESSSPPNLPTRWAIGPYFLTRQNQPGIARRIAAVPSATSPICDQALSQPENR